MFGRSAALGAALLWDLLPTYLMGKKYAAAFSCVLAAGQRQLDCTAQPF